MFLRWLTVCCCLAAINSRGATVNAWTNPVSGQWEQPYWSLGLPSPDQLVAITNSGYKAVGITASTVMSYSDTLEVDGVRLLAPENAESTLLLNWAGTEKPLTIRNTLEVGSRGRLLNLRSGLEVLGTGDGVILLQGGSVVQDGGYIIATNGNAWAANGKVSLTNGWTQLRGLTLGDGENTAFVEQSGGVLQTGDCVIRNGAMHFYEGYLMGSFVVGYQATNAHFFQYGGTNSGRVIVGSMDYFLPSPVEITGWYHLFSGVLESPGIFLGYGDATGNFEQQSGTVATALLVVGGVPRFGDRGNYWMRDGRLEATNLAIYDGDFEQTGGRVKTMEILTLRGENSRNGYYVPEYQLQDGRLETPGLNVVEYATFYQAGGTNSISGSLTVGPIFPVSQAGKYVLSSGLVENQGAGTYGSGYVGYGAVPGTFEQRGGIHQVNGVLTNAGRYTLSGGVLMCDELLLIGVLVINNTGLAVSPLTNRGAIDMDGGTVLIQQAAPVLGSCRLSSSSFLQFDGSPGVARFEDSSGETWQENSRLRVLGWQGDATGLGANQVVFGDSGTHLTSAQVSQIRFINPGGFPPGTYPAKILSHGEVVPYGTANLVAWGAQQSSIVPILTNIVTLAAGDNRNVALLGDGTLFQWAWDTMLRKEEVLNPGVTGASAVAAAWSQMALLTNRSIVTWGKDVFGSANIPPGVTNVIGISKVGSISAVVRGDGSAVAWDNLWIGTNYLSRPKRIIEAKGQVLLFEDGTVEVWGHTLLTNVPPSLEQIITVASSLDHSLALKADGTVIGWGYDYYGQATAPAGLNDVVAIAAGNQHSLALRRDGTVVAWGLNNVGQTNVPPGLTNVSTIAAGFYHSLALVGPRASRPFRLIAARDGTLHFTGELGRRYVIQKSPDLVRWSFAENALGTGEETPLVLGWASGSNVFYRAVWVP